MEKPTVGFPFLAAFPSARIPAATKDVNFHFFMHSSAIPVDYNGEFLGLLKGTTYFNCNSLSYKTIYSLLYLNICLNILSEFC
jgi:hypothetical protein